MSTVGYATLQVIPSMKGVANSLTGEAQAAGGSAGTAGGTAFMGGMSGVMKTLAPAALVGAIGVGLFKIGENFDAAFDKMRITTGATGQALEGLKDSFKAVIQDVPADWGDAAQVIGDLNARLGLTGPPLEKVAAQILELTRLTGGDLASNTTSITRLFGDWSISTESQSETLDKLFRATEESGISIGDLSGFMVQFGAPLRQIGFDFDSSAAMFAKFQKEGVNIQTLMPGLRMALKNFAKDGREPAAAFRETVEAIKTLPPEQAKLLAAQVFGTRAATDWVAAIKEGRLELGDMKDAIVNGKDTILGAAKDTEDFGEKWKKFSSTVQVALEPLATVVFAVLGDALGQATEFGSKFIDEIRFSFAFGGWEGVGQLLQDKFASLLDGIIFKDQIIALVEGVFGILKTLFIGFFDTLRGLWDTFAGLFTGDWGRMWNGLVTLFQVPWNLIVGLLGAFAGMMASILAGAWDLIKLGAAAAWDGIQQLLAAAWEWIKGVVGAAIAWVVGVLALGWAAIQGAAESAWNAILGALQFVWEAIKGVIQAAISFVADVISLGWALIQSVTETIWNAISAAISFIWGFIQGVIEGAMSAIGSVISGGWELIKGFISSALDAIVSFVTDGFNNALNAVVGAMLSIGSAVSDGIWTVLGFFGGLASGIVSAVGDLSGLLYDAGSQVISGLLDGIKSAVGAVYDFVSGIAGKIASLKGPLEKDKILLLPAGTAIIAGLRKGIESEWNALAKDLPQIGTQIEAQFVPAGPVSVPNSDGGSLGDPTTHTLLRQIISNQRGSGGTPPGRSAVGSRR